MAGHCRRRAGAPARSGQSGGSRHVLSPVVLSFVAIERKDVVKSVTESDTRAPSQPALDQPVIAIVVANVNRFAIGRIGNDLVAAGTIELNQDFGEIAQIDRLVTAQVEDLAIC